MHPQRSVITRALGTDPDVDVDTFAVAPQPGDVFLICSDGLSSYGRRRRRSSGSCVQHRDDLNAGDAGADPGREPRRRRRQHHGGPLRASRRATQSPPPSEPDEQTRELAALPGDEEDTLHPEDGIAPRRRPSRHRPRSTRWSSRPTTSRRRSPSMRRRRLRQAGLGRRLLALLVIVALIAVIVVLVWWGLAR